LISSLHILNLVRVLNLVSQPETSTESKTCEAPSHRWIFRPKQLIGSSNVQKHNHQCSGSLSDCLQNIWLKNIQYISIIDILIIKYLHAFYMIYTWSLHQLSSIVHQPYMHYTTLLHQFYINFTSIV